MAEELELDSPDGASTTGATGGSVKVLDGEDGTSLYRDQDGDFTLRDNEDGSQDTAEEEANPVKEGREAAVRDYGYADQIRALEEARDRYEQAGETDEQRRKREKREKAARVVNAVSDGIRALSNLYFTTRYAPNMYKPSDAQEKLDERQERLKAEREANRDKYLNYALKLGDVKVEQAKTAREAQAAEEKARLDNEKAEREAQRQSWEEALQPDRRRKAAAEADEAEAKRQVRAQEAENAGDYYKARADTERAKVATEKSKQASNYSSVARNNREDRGEFVAYDGKGKPHYFKKRESADYFAKQQGTYVESPKESVTEKTDDLGSKSTSVTRTSDGHAAGPYSAASNRQKGEEGLGKSLDEARDRVSGDDDGDTVPPSRKKKDDDDTVPPTRRNK